MKRVRVCLVGNEGEFTASSGQGVQRYMYELARRLAASKEIDLRVRKYRPLPFLYNGFTPYVRSMFDGFGSYDLVHSPDLRPLSKVGYGKALTVTTVHDFHVVTMPSPEDRTSLRRILGLYFVLLPGVKEGLNSDYLIADSTQTRDEAAALGYDRKKVYIASLGVDERFLRGRGVARKAARGFKVGYVGSLSSAKNVEFAIKSFRHIGAKDVSFDLWGLGLTEDLRNLAGADKRIGFKGFAPEKDLISIYDSFDCFVHPTFYEGFGLPILEAQSQGIARHNLQKGEDTCGSKEVLHRG